jgi:hypothetical protein
MPRRYVYIEGSFHITYSWLNGKSLGQHNAGYTSFWLRLDDAGVKFGQSRRPHPITVHARCWIVPHGGWGVGVLVGRVCLRAAP